MTDTLQQTRYDRLLRRVGGIIGPGSKVGAVIADLFPMIDVERVPGELLALMGTRLAWGSTNQAGFVALVNQAQLFNPVGSGMLITVTRLEATSGNTQRLAMGVVDVALTSVPTEQFRDGRLGIAQLPVGQLRIATAAAQAPQNFIFAGVGPATPSVLSDDNGIVTLPPGTGLQISNLTVQTTLFCSWMWRERPAEQSELTL